MWSQIRVATGVILGGWFIYIGIQHFVNPIWFEPIVPEILGWPRFWVLASGIAEIIVGIPVSYTHLTLPTICSV